MIDEPWHFDHDEKYAKEAEDYFTLNEILLAEIAWLRRYAHRVAPLKIVYEVLRRLRPRREESPPC
jgi:hypothetical protein